MIQQLLNIDNYATDERKARRKGSDFFEWDFQNWKPNN